MSTETAKIVEAQTKLLTLDLQVVLQRLRIKEYRTRADVLLAKANVEEHKLNMMEKQRIELDNETKETD